MTDAPQDADARAQAEAPASTGTSLGAWVVTGLVLLIAVVVLLPGLGAAGLWSEGEIAVLDRSLAALGEPRSDMVRSPWLPDQLRTWSFAALGRSDLGLRLPGALAGLGLVGLSVLAGRRLGWSPVWAGVAGLFALATPLLLSGARTVLGNPTGELWSSAAVLACLAAVRGEELSGARRWIVLVLGVACLGASIASLGIVLGGALPLVVIGLGCSAVVRGEHGDTDASERSPLDQGLRAAVWVGAVACAGVGIRLVVGQGEGYIPLLAAAKDLELVEDPTRRVFSAGLEDFGYGLFPFTGLVVAGLFAPGKARVAALWLGAAVVAISVWSLIYGETPAPVVVPAALLATAALRRLVDAEASLGGRRLILTLAVLGALILAKDAGRTPAQVASPLFFLGEGRFPGAHLGLDETLPSLAMRFAALLILAYALSPAGRGREALGSALPTDPERRSIWERLAARVEEFMSGVRERARARGVAALGGDEQAFAQRQQTLATAVVALALTAEAFAFGRGVLDELGGQLSVAGPLASWSRSVEAGADSRLAMYRIRDPGVARYGPGPATELFLSSRAELDIYLSGLEPGMDQTVDLVGKAGEVAEVSREAWRSALIRRTDLPSAYTGARLRGHPFHVLDASHHDYVLVANFLPEGAEDQNPLFEVLHQTEAEIEAVRAEVDNQTKVAWSPYVELVAWEVGGDLHRGGTMVLDLVFEVQRPLPAGTKLYARLQKGKSSRVGAMPRELTGGTMPPNYWRKGDLIHHHEELEIPWLEVLPGTHELIVGLRRSEKKNLGISTPEGDTGEFGVMIKGKKREFAVIGTVELDW